MPETPIQIITHNTSNYEKTVFNMHFKIPTTLHISCIWETFGHHHLFGTLKEVNEHRVTKF